MNTMPVEYGGLLVIFLVLIVLALLKFTGSEKDPDPCEYEGCEDVGRPPEKCPEKCPESK